jgi:hypothetical protein
MAAEDGIQKGRKVLAIAKWVEHVQSSAEIAEADNETRM